MIDDEAPAAEDRDWQSPSLVGLRAVSAARMPAVELLLVDDLAAYVMGAGPLPEPYTVENGSRVLSSLLSALIGAAAYSPPREPLPTAAITSLRTSFVTGAHKLAELGEAGLVILADRLVPAVIGELERQKADPGAQTRSLFYYSMLAVASGPMNLAPEQAAAGALELFDAWDAVFGAGIVLPWRQLSR